MLDTLYLLAATAPDRLALVEETRQVTYGELTRQIDDAATALRSADIGPGERLLFWDTGKAAYLITLLACMQEQVTLVPLHPQTPAAWRASVAAQLNAAAATPGLAALQHGELERQPGERVAGDPDVLAILMTSGTTGAPKGVPVHAAMATAAAHNTVAVFGLDADSRFLDYIPPFTVGGLFLTGLPMLLAGCTSLVRSFSPFAFAGAVMEGCPTHAILLPTMVAVLRNTSSWPQLDLSGFAAIGSGASTVPESVAEELLARGARRFLHLYGSTECLTPVMVHASTRQSASERTIFSELCGDYQARLADDGELLLRGTAVMRGYLGAAAQNQEAFEDGWFKTGDLFQQESDLWRISGRKKEVLKVGGFSVSPALTEKTILDLPGVRNCAVVKETLRSGGEALVAVVEGDDVTPRSVLQHCADRLPPVQTPRRALIVDALPLNTMRKIDRQAVAALVATYDPR